MIGGCIVTNFCMSAGRIFAKLMTFMLKTARRHARRKVRKESLHYYNIIIIIYIN